DRSHIEYGSISQYATPRRLTLLIDNVAEKQKDRTVKKLGPPKKIAFDDKNGYTKAATGFARTLNIDVKDLAIEETERGPYLSATIEEKGRLTKDVLAEALPGLISSLQIPRSMRWGDSSLRYFRPIHWILATLGNELVPFALDGIKSGNISYGHRFLSPATIAIEDARSYLNSLRKNHVIADIAERKKAISEGIGRIESSAGCRVIKDDELLDIVTNLVEYPVAVCGSFDKKYLELPKELLITVMRSHQKYFSVEDSAGNMLPAFIVISNTMAENSDTVRKGAERVLRARLEDARFYFIEDRKLPLQAYTEELKKVTFQEKLGSIFKKTERISSLCSFIADKLDIKQRENLLRASTLCKADLVTGVVREFPELQGHMGMTYALSSGEDRDVAAAIFEHYLPRFAGDSLPSGETGAIISIADKMDNIASFFSLGMVPTGSEDPFALRRQATGIIHILQNSEYPLLLDDLIERSLGSLDASPGEKETLSEAILQFFYQRLEGILLAQGHSYDLVNAVLASRGTILKELRHRISVLSDLRKDPRFPGLLTAAKRVYNILSKAAPGNVNEALLAEQAEKELYDAAAKIKDRLASTGFMSLFELEMPVNTFFDKVLVMDRDTAIRENRLALLSCVRTAFDSLGNFSKIVD
ncbi:MAG: glycine--tRNA ligase subunit beta, partial [Nitrospirota bacterium]|nr:glycine--tRNA ligase subunit beta [Nitrospirota bacterium]